jgi:hypothetical protein
VDQRWAAERLRLAVLGAYQRPFGLEVEFWLALVNAAIVIGWLLRRAWSCHR